jgi:hypothetical protein
MREFDITWVKDGRNLGEKNVGEMLNPTKGIGVSFRKEVQYGVNGPDGYVYTVYYLSNLSSKDYGTAYFMMTELYEDLPTTYRPTRN